MFKQNSKEENDINCLFAISIEINAKQFHLPFFSCVISFKRISSVFALCSTFCKSANRYRSHTHTYNE